MMSFGDFTGVAADYARYRPDYSKSVVRAALGLTGKQFTNIRTADIGAGTGIFTAMLANAGIAEISAVEPNDEMRKVGIAQNYLAQVDWNSGSAENTGLPESSFDWISMASSLHWADFEAATREFHRILDHDGIFTCIWNTRKYEDNPVLLDIEDYLDGSVPNLKRVSSGRSGITTNLTERLNDCQWFQDVIYLEGQHVIEMSPARYLGVWHTVNDIRVQLGEDKFANFIKFINRRIEGLKTIPCGYLTRAWCAHVAKPID